MLLVYILEEYSIETKIFLAIFFVAFAAIFIYYGIRTIEIAYVMRKGKPLFIHKYLILKKAYSRATIYFKTTLLFL